MHKELLRKILISLLFWVPVIIFLKLAGEIIEKEPPRFDLSILYWLHQQATPLLDSIFIFVTEAGGIVSMTVISTLILIWLIYKKQYENVKLLIVGFGGAVAANVILKTLFQRDRPSLWHQSIVETGFSFPSGHAMASAALITCLVIMLWSTKWRWLSVTLGSIIVLAIGTSRAYLGVHYPSDIIAGWCVSVAWVLLVTYLIRTAYKRKQRSS